MVLAVNKYDLIEQLEKENGFVDEPMTQSYLENFAYENGFSGIFRTSAKTGGNVTNAFSLLVREILKRKAEQEENDEHEDNYHSARKQSVTLNKIKADSKKSKKG
mmetsp:Transcript_35562/g.41157  ORF Transcript_35562/g.41157 Transcript_35562/m.41157 type:complete len:105 (-) Transcript_35562:49-363(-)